MGEHTLVPACHDGAPRQSHWIRFLCASEKSILIRPSTLRNIHGPSFLLSCKAFTRTRQYSHAMLACRFPGG